MSKTTIEIWDLYEETIFRYDDDKNIKIAKQKWFSEEELEKALRKFPSVGIRNMLGLSEK